MLHAASTECLYSLLFLPPRNAFSERIMMYTYVALSSHKARLLALCPLFHPCRVILPKNSSSRVAELALMQGNPNYHRAD